ncbi:MAG: DegT/DnrJ/EryC1/StrS family aminotransferase [Elusimicrobiales bacterium]|nr:DegT/DnrJ/EryC1/StrS family aminotransferase [Elusimicrobiales bacterium]
MTTTTATIPIPLFNLKQQHAAIQKEINEAVVRVLESMQWILGPENAAFEKEFAAMMGVKYCVTCSSGAAALQIALNACGVGPGDEVITTPFTFIATTSSITLTGAKFVFADIDPAACNIDPKQIEKKITKKTKAILPVHLYGYPADMGAIMEIAKKHNLKVIEDCAQSHLAEYNGRMTGGIGHAGAFSFYPSKNLGACGDAGAVTTNDETVAKAALSLRHCGRMLDKAYEYCCEGSTLRMDEVQAAILRIKLRHLKNWTEMRRKAAKLYDAGLKGLPVTTPPATKAGWSQSFYVYTIKAPRRDELAAHLKSRGIASAIYYPLALYSQPVYKGMGFHAADYPNTERATAEALSLPMFPELSAEQVERVCREIRAFYGK